jgi:hypothetical protein
MPNVGILRRELADRVDRAAHGVGIAGPVRQEQAVGLERAHVGRLVSAGTTTTRQPMSTRLRKMLSLMPKSNATTSGPSGFSSL